MRWVAHGQPLTIRHPELVSGSMVVFLDIAPLDGKIKPVGIILFDEIDFPLTMPALQLLLARNCVGHRVEEFCMNEAKNTIFGSESACYAISVLPDAFDQV